MTHKTLALLLATGLSALVGCQSTTPTAAAPGPGGNIKKMDPLDFLEYLRTTPDRTCTVVGVTGVWVKDRHLPKLFELLDSDRKCASVVNFIWCPHVDIGKPTTVGREAGFLIRSFTTKQYPAPLGSTMSEADKNELRNWYRQYKNQNN